MSEDRRDWASPEPFRPRWICAANVDTPAMYCAALKFRLEQSDAWHNILQLEGNLWIIEHDFLWARPTDHDHVFVHIACTKVNCPRCSGRKGGYVFRWYSDLWKAEYIRKARSGAWRPGDCEDEV